MLSIQTLHEQIAKHLLERRTSDPLLNFTTRLTNKGKRLDQGYWFIGNDSYLQVSFWTGRDWKEKIHNIAFVVNIEKQCYIEIVSQDDGNKAEVLSELVSRLGEFKSIGNKKKWWRPFHGGDVLSNLDKFIDTTIPQIDQILSVLPPVGIKRLNGEEFEGKYQRALLLRLQHEASGEGRKLVRICFNSNGWKFPSGRSGKSKSPKAYEYVNGFGHEEWIFDKSKTIDGFKYAFLEPLRVMSGKHVGSIYQLNLFTRTRDGRKFLVATIDNCTCISPEESAHAYEHYRQQGWIEEMIEHVYAVDGSWSSNISNNAERFFNVRFRFVDVTIHGMKEIAPWDSQIRTNHPVLLPLRRPLNFDIITEDSGRDARKNLAKRHRQYDGNCEYDPYHDMMQVELLKILRATNRYRKVLMEDAYVDIKGLTNDGRWHFYEVKTDTPKVCIRKAIGQLLEYSSYPSANRADLLIIIGEEKPDYDTISYLQHLRSLYKLPLVYRSFDLENKILSIDY